jgi:hypothetical protein
MFSRSPDALADFGLTPRKARKALTPAELVRKAEKAKATREARHTMGKRQKLAIHGSAPVVAVPTAPSPTSSVVNGAAHPVNGSPLPSAGGS